LPYDIFNIMATTAENTTYPAPVAHVGDLAATSDIERIEAPVTWQAYLMCAFAAIGGIFYGYDTGYIGNVNAMDVCEI
jgi:hypothetical protein